MIPIVLAAFVACTAAGYWLGNRPDVIEAIAKPWRRHEVVGGALLVAFLMLL